MTLLYWLTGGRPMTYESEAFYDSIDRVAVKYWRDGFGRRWMAAHRWSFFRVLTVRQ